MLLIEKLPSHIFGRLKIHVSLLHYEYLSTFKCAGNMSHGISSYNLLNLLFVGLLLNPLKSSSVDDKLFIKFPLCFAFRVFKEMLELPGPKANL